MCSAVGWPQYSTTPKNSLDERVPPRDLPPKLFPWRHLAKWEFVACFSQRDEGVCAEQMWLVNDVLSAKVADRREFVKPGIKFV